MNWWRIWVESQTLCVPRLCPCIPRGIFPLSRTTGEKAKQQAEGQMKGMFVPAQRSASYPDLWPIINDNFIVSEAGESPRKLTAGCPTANHSLNGKLERKWKQQVGARAVGCSRLWVASEHPWPDSLREVALQGRQHSFHCMRCASVPILWKTWHDACQFLQRSFSTWAPFHRAS